MSNGRLADYPPFCADLARCIPMHLSDGLRDRDRTKAAVVQGSQLFEEDAMPLSERELLARARDALLTCSPGDYSTCHIIHPQYDEEKVETVLADIDAQLKEPAQDGWPKLEKPAKVIGTFGVGVSSRLVVEAAQRAYEYDGERKAKTPEQWREEERARRELWAAINGPLDDPEPAQDERKALAEDDRLTQYAQMLARARAIYASPQPAAQSEVNVAEDERKV